MKIRISLITVLFLICISALGQDKLNKLKAPSSPGASVIGIQPTTILTPKSYQALEANLFTNYVGEGGQLLIPNDIGLEFSPYWFGEQAVDVYNYLFPNPWQALIRNLSISIASTQKYMLGDSTNTNAMGIGLRTSMYFPTKIARGQADIYLKENMNDIRIKDEVVGIAALILVKHNDEINTRDKFIKALNDSVKEKNDGMPFFESKDACKFTMSKLSKDLKDKLDANISPDLKIYIDLINEFLDVLLERLSTIEKLELIRDLKPGFSIDMAWAMALNFPTNRFDYSMVPRNGLWLTLTYRFNDRWKFLKVLGVLNYNWYSHTFFERYFPEQKFYDNTLDYGLGLNFTYKKFAAQLEAVGRQSKSIFERSVDNEGITTTRSKIESDFQYIANISYQISDGMVITYSIGNRFEPVFTYNGTLVNTLSLNFGFGGPMEKDIK